MITTPRRSAVNTNDMLGLLMRDLDRYPMPNYDEQVELAKRVTAGDEEAKKQMVAANLRLVLHWARREGETLGRDIPRTGELAAAVEEANGFRDRALTSWPDPDRDFGDAPPTLGTLDVAEGAAYLGPDAFSARLSGG